jgi:hypothetical protein
MKNKEPKDRPVQRAIGKILIATFGLIVYFGGTLLVVGVVLAEILCGMIVIASVMFFAQFEQPDIELRSPHQIFMSLGWIVVYIGTIPACALILAYLYNLPQVIRETIKMGDEVINNDIMPRPKKKKLK